MLNAILLHHLAMFSLVFSIHPQLLNIPWSKDRDSGRTVPRVRNRGTVLPSNDTAVISDRMRCHEFTHIQLSGIDSHRVMNDPVQDGVSNDTATEARMPFTGFVL